MALVDDQSQSEGPANDFVVKKPGKNEDSLDPRRESWRICVAFELETVRGAANVSGNRVLSVKEAVTRA